MADLQEITEFPILNIIMETFSPPEISSEWPELDMAVLEQFLLLPIDVHRLILKSWSKMTDLLKIRGFHILNILRPSHSRITGVNDLSWTCLCMNNVCYCPLICIYL